MPLLVHIAPGNAAGSIRRNGIAPTRWRPDSGDGTGHDRGVWAFPILPSYELTHSWSRELKRFGNTTLTTVTFRLPDSELVLAHHFRDAALPMTAAKACGLILAATDPRGYEIIVPRRIWPREIVRLLPLRRPVGWRYWPEAKGKPMPLCDCPVCARKDEVKSRRYRERLRARMRAAGYTPESDMPRRGIPE